MWGAHECRCLQNSKESLRSPKAGVTDGCESPDIGSQTELESSGRPASAKPSWICDGFKCS